MEGFFAKTYSRPDPEFLRVVSAVFVFRKRRWFYRIAARTRLVWRASLEGVRTGERRGFASIDALLDLYASKQVLQEIQIRWKPERRVRC